MRFLLLLFICLMLVWFLVAKPDLEDEYSKIHQVLSSEVSLRSQALTSVMEKFRLASVLLARSGIVEDVVQNAQPNSELFDRIRYLQSVASVKSISVLRRNAQDGFPLLSPPTELVKSGRWARAVATAFQGSLGREFYLDEDNSPTYLFFAPHFMSGQQPSAIIITTIDLGLVGDNWQVSGNRVALWSHDGDLMLKNNVVVPDNAITVERNHIQLGATLRVSATPPALFGTWWQRSVLVSLLFTVAGLLLVRQFERRKFLMELADQQANEAHRLEREINERTSELKAAQHQIMQTEKLALLGQMSASISHEINQPLAALKNYASTADRLLKKNKIAEVKQNLSLISRLTDRIARVVVNLRSFANNEPSQVQRINVGDVILEAMSELIDRFPAAKECCFFFQSTRSVPAYALAGKIRLLQVLANLLTNAWYACRESNKPMIHIELVSARDTHCIRITDSGPGFDPDMTHTAFDAFVSSRSDNKGDIVGMGLGLSISRSFIESMNGKLSLESSTNAGAVLMITLHAISDQ